MAPVPTNSMGSRTTPGPGTGYFRSELNDLKVIGVEEHVIFPNLTSRIESQGLAAHAKDVFSQLVNPEALSYARGRSTEIRKQRIQDIDDSSYTYADFKPRRAYKLHTHATST